MSQKKFLVTGGAGFIGSNIVEELIKKGHAVRVLDNFSTGKRENLKPFADDIEVIEGDIRSYHLVLQATKGINTIYHEAALPSVQRSIDDPITSSEVNVSGTLNILEAARENGVEKIVFASSSSVYGDNPELPKNEDMKANPLSPYAVSKLASEKYCAVFSKIYGLQTVSLRYFNVFGKRQDPNSQYSAVIPLFITKIAKNERPIIYGDGEQSRDFTHIENVVYANMLASENISEHGLAMNCACHDRITLNQLVKEINTLIGKSIEPIYANPRSGDIRHSFADISLAEKKLGYVPKVSFIEGLKKTIESYV